MADWRGMRRVYERVEVVSHNNGYAIQLDRHLLKSPAGNDLCFFERSLADAIAAEWDAQERTINTSMMPITSYATTLVDRVTQSRDEMATDLLAFAVTDTLCHRVDKPADLVRRQQEAWQPWLDWAAAEFDAPLAHTADIFAPPQPAASLRKLSEVISAMDNARFLAAFTIAASTGSLILALAMVNGQLDADQVTDAALLEEQYRLDSWGDDEEANERMRAIRGELRNTQRFVALLNN